MWNWKMGTQDHLQLLAFLIKEQTFKLPQQEQGVSILKSSSSSWHILHSTNFPGDFAPCRPFFINETSTSVSFNAEDLACITLFLLSSAASNVDSKFPVPITKKNWTPHNAYREPGEGVNFINRKGTKLEQKHRIQH
ncbi:hypothetical protein Lal_00000578 [Lupinus albus]|nr:hypothetical protein Lal_00000578 [Lupinus albus]